MLLPMLHPAAEDHRATKSWTYCLSLGGKVKMFSQGRGTRSGRGRGGEAARILRHCQDWPLAQAGLLAKNLTVRQLYVLSLRNIPVRIVCSMLFSPTPFLLRTGYQHSVSTAVLGGYGRYADKIIHHQICDFALYQTVRWALRRQTGKPCHLPFRYMHCSFFSCSSNY